MTAKQRARHQPAHQNGRRVAGGVRKYPPERVGSLTKKKPAGNFLVARGVVKKILDDPKSAFFMRPVDEIGDEAPGYFTLIKRPMDLGSILFYIENDMYDSLEEIRTDVAQVWENCRIYNGQAAWGSIGNILRIHADLLEHEFEDRWSRLVEQNADPKWGAWLEDRKRLQRVFPMLPPHLVHTLLCVVSLGSPEVITVRRLGSSGIRCECAILNMSTATVRTCLSLIDAHDEAQQAEMPRRHAPILAWPRDIDEDLSYHESVFS
eukprot:TRINITY_DN61262_c0_g1_i1.p1 TRINITY_DN61262_c0_g1~~TRINITY_DN61262_c0_g1_i1.p1  ORF type:complete len:264 (+),score=42.08 TRINITY_DN61262_c0_g1_i1:190-981(+)